mmetsp:Transcript_38546/g.84604  ORF Transcript_38546/g.84604 Transcript_38546/m.84604 type:complete len:606 (-) Transcript_38546:79-1896(-)
MSMTMIRRVVVSSRFSVRVSLRSSSSLSSPVYDRITETSNGRSTETSRPKFSTLHPHDINPLSLNLHRPAGFEEPSASTSTPDRSSTSAVSLNFESPISAHGDKTTTELLRAILVYTLCQIQPLVDHAGSLINASRNVFGNKITDTVLRHTFFMQFCAGEDTESIRPRIESMQKANVGAILDYAAENEGEDSAEGPSIVTQPPYNQPARTYEYKSENDCDRHVETFLSCIRSVRDVTPDGFAALKVTALGNPFLLERLSTAITESRKLLAMFDVNGDGVITKEDFATTYEALFTDADDRLPELLTRLDPFDKNEIDYIEWSRLLRPEDLPRITASCAEIGPLALACPSDEELRLMETMHQRLRTLADEAENCGVRLLIDAEQFKFQPAIDNLVLDLQQEYNSIDRTDTPVIFHTYQCYLKETMDKIRLDLERSQRYSYHFAAKLVRGAYLHHERCAANKMGYDDPIHGTIEDTHATYDSAVEYLLRSYAEDNANVEFMCATHNQKSIEKAIQLTREYGLDPNEPPIVHFAQLLGMSDNLTNTLGVNGYRAYKYVPYGKVDEVMPYLLRRAQENSGMLAHGGSMELDLLVRELKRRMTPRLLGATA